MHRTEREYAPVAAAIGLNEVNIMVRRSSKCLNDPHYSALICGDVSQALWFHFFKWKSELNIRRDGTLIIVDYLPPIDHTYCEVCGVEWLERLEEFISTSKIRATWIGCVSNMDNQWTSWDLEKGEEPSFGKGELVNPCGNKPHDITIKKE